MAERDREAVGPAHEAGERAAKNTVVRAAGDILGKVASLLLFAVLARAVGEAGVGVYVFAFALWQIVLLPSEAGLDRYFVRRVARDRSRHDELLNLVSLKVALALPVLAVTLVVVTLVDPDPLTRTTIYLLGPGLLLDSLGRSIFAFFNGYERGGLIALSLVVQRFAAAGLGLGALALGYGVAAVAATYTVGAALGVGAGLALFRRHIAPLRGHVAPAGWRALTTRSLPFGAQDAFAVLLSKIDAVILTVLATEAAVGRYGAAYRLLEATFFVNFAIAGAFAAMYTYLDHDTEPTVQAVFQRSVKLSLGVLVPVAAAFAVFAEPIAVLFFGADFEGAAEPLRLLAPTVVLISLSALSSALIVSRRSPAVVVGIVAGMVALNVALNFLLIPPLADRGAAAAMLITEALGVAAVLTVAVRTVRGLDWLATAAAPLAAGAAMVLVLLLLPTEPVLAVVAGAAVYVAVFVALERVISPMDLEFVAAMLRRRLPSRLVG